MFVTFFECHTTKSLLTLFLYRLPSLLMQAAHSAAQADGVAPTAPTSGEMGGPMMQSQMMQAKQKQNGVPPGGGGGGGGGGKKKGPPLRRG